MKILILSVFLALGFCQHLTVAPEATAPHTESSWAKENILEADATGVLVTSEWVRVYKAMLDEYLSKLTVAERPLTPNEGITAEGKKYRVTFVVQERFATLRSIDRGRP